MTILVTGGMGYIGSHVVVELIESGHDVVILDNLSNSKKEVLSRLNELTGASIPLYVGDINDREILDRIFTENPKIDGVIHLAGLKSVPESVDHPLAYYRNNVAGTLTLLEALADYNINNIVFSSSATVYGEATEFPITEKSGRQPATNPYGKTKVMIEEILEDLYHKDPSMNIVLLRYFNPIGAHESGLIGEDPLTQATNLVSGLMRVIRGEDAYFSVYGDDYDTPDGTGIRDYIHVVDLAHGHVKALEHLRADGSLQVYNLGTGKGSSVLDILKTFTKVSGVEIPYRVYPRRPGDVAKCYCDITKAVDELGWKPERDLEKMCEDFWRWTVNNPEEYGARDET